MRTPELAVTITLPGFPDEDGDGCPDGFQPNPAFVKPGPAEACVAVPTPAPLPDELANTGPFDIAAAALGAVVLVYAGLSLLGRPMRARQSKR